MDMNFNLGVGLNLGFGGIGYGAGFGGYAGGGFGYNAFNSMLGGMLYGGAGAYAGAGVYGGAYAGAAAGAYGTAGAYAGAGAYGGYGAGYGGAFGALAGLGGFMGLNGSMNLPIYDKITRQAWDTTLASTLGKRDPLYLDTNHDGTLNVEKKEVVFDMNGDGVMDRMHEWNTKDAQLVYDANGDGQINNGRELMNEIGLDGKQGAYKNGWEKALAIFDTDKDGKISGEELKKARLWTDANGNGKVDKGELKTASEMGIMSLDPNSKTYDSKEQVGNIGMNFGMGGFGGLFGGLGSSLLGGLLGGGFGFGGGIGQNLGGFNPLSGILGGGLGFGGGFNPMSGVLGGLLGGGFQGFNPFGGGLGIGGGLNSLLGATNPLFGLMNALKGFGVNPNSNTSNASNIAAPGAARVDNNKLLALREVFLSRVNSHEKQISRINEPRDILVKGGFSQTVATKLATAKIVQGAQASVQTLVSAGISIREATLFAQQI